MIIESGMSYQCLTFYLLGTLYVRTVIGELVNIIREVVSDLRLQVIVRSLDGGLDGATVHGPGSWECRRLEFDRHHMLGISAWLAADPRHLPSVALQSAFRMRPAVPVQIADHRTLARLAGKPVS